MLCIYYTLYATRMVDSRASSAESIPAPFNIESCSRIFTWWQFQASCCIESELRKWVATIPLVTAVLFSKSQIKQNSSQVPNDVIHMCAGCPLRGVTAPKLVVTSYTDKEKTKKCTLAHWHMGLCGLHFLKAQMTIKQHRQNCMAISKK